MNKLIYIFSLTIVFALICGSSFAGPRKATGESASVFKSVSENTLVPQNSAFIKFSIPEYEEVSLKIYDASGNEISNLYKGLLRYGTYYIEFDTENLASGNYIYQLKTESLMVQKKVEVN